MLPTTPTIVDPRSIGTALTSLDSSPHGIAIREVASRQCIIDQSYTWRLKVITIGEQSPSHEWRIQDTKVIRTNGRNLRTRNDLRRGMADLRW